MVQISQILSDAKAKEALQLIQSYQKLKAEEPLKFYNFYDWQKEAINCLGHDIELTLLAGNRCGKTLSGCAIVAINVLGEYPDWYTGIRFNHPLKILALGVTAEQIRDVLMRTLVGDIDPHTRNFLGGGLIPKKRLYAPVFDKATAGALREVRVRHKDGYYSTIKFRSYSQGPEVLRGPAYDLIQVDEEPPHEQGLPIYAECLARIALGNKGKGGRLILTFTPENGYTQLVDRLYNHPKPRQKLLCIGWDKAPHITQEMKDHLLKTIPTHLLSCKTEGKPSFGDTKVFKVDESEIKCEPFPIPDHYYICCAIDFGISHPFAACFVALDRDKNIVYVFDAFEMTNTVPAQQVARINNQLYKVPVIFPHDGDNREKGSGETLKSEYAKIGLNLIAKFSNDDGTNHLEPGLLKLNNMMVEGTLKVFTSCQTFWDSFRKFRRNPTNGKLVEDGKDSMDAFRYAALSVHRYGQRKNELGKKYTGRTYPIIYPTYR